MTLAEVVRRWHGGGCLVGHSAQVGRSPPPPPLGFANELRVNIYYKILSSEKVNKSVMILCHIPVLSLITKIKGKGNMNGRLMLLKIEYVAQARLAKQLLKLRRFSY